MPALATQITMRRREPIGAPARRIKSTGNPVVSRKSGRLVCASGCITTEFIVSPVEFFGTVGAEIPKFPRRLVLWGSPDG